MVIGETKRIADQTKDIVKKTIIIRQFGQDIRQALPRYSLAMPDYTAGLKSGIVEFVGQGFKF